MPNTLKYQYLISKSETIAFERGPESYVISQEETLQVKEYFAQANWEHIIQECDCAPSEYVIFDDLIVGIIEHDETGTISMLVIDKSRNQQSNYELSGSEFPDVFIG